MFAKKLAGFLIALCIALSVSTAVSFLPLHQVHANSTTYYINNQAGSNCSDAGTGTSQSAPWCDFTPVNSHTFGPGDQILLARGATWDQQMTINGSGSSTAYATIDAYGSGANPKIIRNGNASDRAIRMNNPSYWNVNNLEVGNAGAGILVFYSTIGNQGLNFNNIFSHDVRGIHHQGIANNYSCYISPDQISDYIWNSSGIEITGSVTSVPAGQYVLQNMNMTNISGTHNQNSVSIDWCNGATGNAANVVLNGLNLHDDTGPAEGCDDGMRLTDVTNLIMLNSILNNEAACYSSTGTAAIFTAFLNNATIVNSIIENTPNTGSPDQTGIDYEGWNNQTRLRDDYVAANAGPGVEVLTIHGSGSNDTNSEFSGNTFVNNATARAGQYLGALDHIGTDANPTGTISDNLYYEPTGLTYGNFSAFNPPTNNIPIATSSYIYNAAAGYSSTQGQNGWSYQYSNDGSTWINLPYNSSANLWQDTTRLGGVPYIGQFIQHPDVCSGCWVGRTWTSTKNGKVSIRGRVLKSDTGGGDGVIARITKNGSVIWGPQTVAYNDQVGIATNLDNLTVASGDVIRFEVANNGNNTYDATSWVPTVAYTATNTIAFNRYFNSSVSDHWVTTGSVTSGYNLETTLGYLLTSSQSNTQQLYGCQIGQDHFISTQSNCEGYTVLRAEGWIYTTAPSGVATKALYRCFTGTDHFVSIDPNCEGQRVESLLGYALSNP